MNIRASSNTNMPGVIFPLDLASGHRTASPQTVQNNFYSAVSTAGEFYGSDGSSAFQFAARIEFQRGHTFHLREHNRPFRCLSRSALLMFACTAAAAFAQTPDAAPQHDFFRVTLDHSFARPVSGRLLLFIAANPGDGNSVDMDMMSPTSVYVAAKEVVRLVPGESVDIDADDLVFPRPLALAPAGKLDSFFDGTADRGAGGHQVAWRRCAANNLLRRRNIIVGQFIPPR